LTKCVSDVNYPHFNPSHSPSEIWRYAPVDTRVYNLGRANSKTTYQQKIQICEINELLLKINRMKSKIDAMSNTLETEIKHAWFSGALKTHKRNKLRELSDELNVPENPTLDEITTAFANFKIKLEICSSDPKLRQGVLSTRSKTLLDELSLEVSTDTNPVKKFK
jgi:hypothetical protein